MELTLNKVSFADEFKKVRNTHEVKAKDRSEGFKYLHNMTTKRFAEGGEFSIGLLDFTKFTMKDIEDYMEYYNESLLPKISTANALFKALSEAGSVFSPKKRFY